MGFDVFASKVVEIYSNGGGINNCLTIGRQTLESSVKKDMPRFLNDKYCENLIKAVLSVDVVDSIDFSNYEGSTHIFDFNKKVNGIGPYDLILDFGSLEHMFNQAQAFENIRSLLKENGWVSHILPVNNLNGHGFWQYSSDLIYDIYSEKNGFQDTVLALQNS